MIEAVDVYGTAAQKLLGEMVRDSFFLTRGYIYPDFVC